MRTKPACVQSSIPYMQTKAPKINTHLKIS